MTEPTIRGLVARRVVSLADIPTVNRIGSSNGGPGSIVTAFGESDSEAEAFEFSDIKDALRFRHGISSFIQGRVRHGNLVPPVRVANRGTTVYLIRKPESSNGQVPT